MLRTDSLLDIVPHMSAFSRLGFSLKTFLATHGIHIARYPFSHQEAFKDSMNLNLAVQAGGVLHLGAHTGQEASTYNLAGLNVIWIEAIPDIFHKLQKNIEPFKKQRALCAILGDTNGQAVKFQISNNEAVSSSIFSLREESFRESFDMATSLDGTMTRLDSLLAKKEILSLGHWVVDLQGAELLALQGAGNLLESCKSMYIEVSTRKIYEGGVQWNELNAFLTEKGFYPLWVPREDSHENVLYLKN
jgi:FkbM family methyltransferase